MRGSIQKKGKQWYAVVYDGVNPETGNYRRRWIPAGTRRSDAERVLAELVKRSHDGQPVVSERITLGEYLTQRWLPVQQSRLRPSTFDPYRRNICLHVIPAIGRIPLDRLTAEDLDVLYALRVPTTRPPTLRGQRRPPHHVGYWHPMACLARR